MSSASTAVVAAVIERDGQYLVAKRPMGKRHGGMWEFPGGKLEANETFADAARRELAEELAVQVVEVGEVLAEVGDPGASFVVSYVAVKMVGEPQMLEHQELAWVSADDLPGLLLAPSDAHFVEKCLGQ